MKLKNLISLITVTISMAITTGVNAQERLADNAQQYSIGPAIEFGGGGTSFGIKGKIGVGQQFSIRPMILFGYKPSVSGSDILKGTGTNNQVTNQPIILDPRLITPTDTKNANLVSEYPGSGIGYGLALTYDFKSADGKIQGYIGPRILFGSASNSVNITGSTASALTLADGASITTSTSETNIGLTAGTDFAISENFTAGVNATYDFYRSGNYNFSGNSLVTGATSINAPLSGGNFKFGVNVGYNF
jgi:Opacity family porin protein